MHARIKKKGKTPKKSTTASVIVIDKEDEPEESPLATTRENSGAIVPSRSDLMQIVPVLTAKRSERGEERLDPLEYPPLLCNGCEAANVCPFYKPSNECAWEPLLDFKLEGGADIVNLMMEVVRVEARRFKTAVVKERLMGGSMNPELSMRSDALFQKCVRVKELAENERVNQNGSGGGGVLNELFKSILPSS